MCRYLDYPRCRLAILSEYLDGEARTCSDPAVACDRCYAIGLLDTSDQGRDRGTAQRPMCAKDGEKRGLSAAAVVALLAEQRVRSKEQFHEDFAVSALGESSSIDIAIRTVSATSAQLAVAG
jgi:hypothetical protein